MLTSHCSAGPFEVRVIELGGRKVTAAALVCLGPTVVTVCQLPSDQTNAPRSELISAADTTAPTALEFAPPGEREAVCGDRPALAAAAAAGREAAAVRPAASVSVAALELSAPPPPVGAPVRVQGGLMGCPRT